MERNIDAYKTCPNAKDCYFVQHGAFILIGCHTLDCLMGKDPETCKKYLDEKR